MPDNPSLVPGTGAKNTALPVDLPGPMPAAAPVADSVTQLLSAGPVCNGFAAANQEKYNQKVQELLLDGMFGHDYFHEDNQAFDIFRVR